MFRVRIHRAMRRVVWALCAAEVLAMLGVFAFPALLPIFQAQWGLSNTDAGIISGTYFAAYAVAVPVLAGLTDRVDARLITFGGIAAAGLSCLGMALLADGFWSALVLRSVGGIGLAGSYMPGLRALVDRVGGPLQTRAMAFYTASFSLGTSLSFLLVGAAAERWGWRWAFGLAALAAAAALPVLALLAPVRPHRPDDAGAMLDFRPVLRNRTAMAYICGYTVHCWELFGLRSWLVAFLTFVAAGEATPPAWSPTMVATASALVAMAASIIGADLTARTDRARLVAVFMATSGLAALGLGFTAGLGYGLVAGLCVVYSALIQLDSAALTTGAVLAAAPGRRGQTIALHSLLGFLAAFLAPLALGSVLDLAGGGRLAWGLAFASLGVVAMLGPPMVMRARRLP